MAVGCGWQAWVAYINLGCYYIIGFPLGIVMGWVWHLGVAVRSFPPFGSDFDYNIFIHGIFISDDLVQNVFKEKHLRFGYDNIVNNITQIRKKIYQVNA